MQSTRLWGAAAAALAFSATSLMVRLVSPWPSFFDLAADRLLGAIPGATFALLLERLQHGGKPVLLSSLLLLSVIIFGAASFGYEQVTARLHRLRPPILAALLALGLWLACGWAVGAFGLPDPQRRLTLAAALPGFVAFALGLVVAFPSFLAGGRPVDPGRRRLAIGLGSVMLAANAGLLWRLVQGMLGPAEPAAAAPSIPSLDQEATGSASPGIGSSPIAASGGAVPGPQPASPPASPVQASTAVASPSPARSPVVSTGEAGPRLPARPKASGSRASTPSLVLPAGMTPEVTPNADFYLVSKNFVDPQVALDSWSLEVSGLVTTPLHLSYARIRAMPAVRQYTTLSCISNLVGGPLVSNALWTGVPLATILRAAGIRPQAKHVRFTAADGYVEGYPLENALAPSTLLAYDMNGQPLPPRHGFPVRIISTGRYGMKNPKWLTKIELLDTPATGYWEREGWDMQAVVQTLSRIDVPKVGQPLPLARPALGGIAFAGLRGISKVEVSLDAGKSWKGALLKPALAPSVWNLWVYPFIEARPGGFDVKVRAADGAGTLQLATRRPSFPAGATGYDEVEVTIR